MEFDTTQLEEEIKALNPVALPDALLDRLDRAMAEAAHAVSYTHLTLPTTPYV